MSIAHARNLAKSHLAHWDASRWAHVRGVAETAKGIAASLRLAEDVLASAAWLHDIGYSPDLVDTGFHPLDGARFLRDQGFQPDVVHLVAHHSGAVIEAEERGMRAQLLAEFPFEPSPMMDALWYCDMTTGPEGQPMSVEERLAEIRERYGPNDVVTRFVERAMPELVGAVTRVEERLDAISRGKAGRYR